MIIVGLLIAGIAIVVGLTWLPALREMVDAFGPETGELIDAIIPLMPFIALIFIILVAVFAVTRRGGV